jgi:formylglycine-generating enzyme required for sulfatase activity
MSPASRTLALPLVLAAGAAALLLPGCSSSSGQVAQALSLFTAPYVVVDLASGAVETRVAIPDLTSDAAYQTTKLVFRRVEAGSGVVGSSAGDFAAQASEVPQAAVALPIYFLAVFELTQAQSVALGGASPWLLAEAAAGGGVVSARAPAYNLDRDTLTAQLAAYSGGRGYRLGLPSDQQWEYACRAGQGAAAFWWGDGIDIATQVKPNAVVFETLDGVQGPRIADGTRAANAFGFFDMAGNVWEWTSDGTGTIRGGSWNDSLPMARSANKVALDFTTRHPLVGARLVFVP